MTTQGDAPEDGIVSGLSFPSREMWVNLCSSRCVRTRVEKEESVLCVTQQSFSSSISSKNGWHTFRKHSLHPSTSVFFSLCLSASFSLHPSLSASLSSFLPAICLFLFHSWVKGLVSTLCFFSRGLLLNAQSAERAQHLSSGEHAVWNSECHSHALDCLSQYIYTKSMLRLKWPQAYPQFPWGFNLKTSLGSVIRANTIHTV